MIWVVYGLFTGTSPGWRAIGYAASQSVAEIEVAKLKAVYHPWHVMAWPFEGRGGWGK